MLGEKLMNLYSELEEFLDKTELKEFLDEVSQEEKEQIIRRALSIIAHGVYSGEIDEEDADDAFVELLMQLKFAMVEAKHKYIFRVKMKGLTKYISRDIAIPSAFTLGDLGVAIILAFNGDCSHLFSFTIDGKQYEVNEKNGYFFGDADVFEVLLNNLDFVPKKKYSFCYDFGEDYDFSVEFVKKVEDMGNYPIEVLKGKGYGIWEDNHHYLEMYYNNPNVLVEDYMGNMVPIKEIMDFDPDDFDCFEINEKLNEFFPRYREKYCPEEESSPYN